MFLDLNDIRVIEPAPSDPFNVPDIDEQHNLYPYQLQQLGRRKASGRVLAIWGGNTALIETPAGSMMRVEMTEGDLPSCGDFIEIAGFPDTDIYRINFTRAKWRKTQAWPVEDTRPAKHRRRRAWRPSCWPRAAPTSPRPGTAAQSWALEHSSFYHTHTR